MEILIEQKYFNFLKYDYKIFVSTNLVFTAKANRTIIPWLRTITVLDLQGKQIYKLKQQNILWFLLEHTPIVNYLIKSSCPYVFYKGDKTKGQLQELYYLNGGTVKANLDDRQFYLYALTGNCVSIFLENNQVGLISRVSWKHGDSDRYRVIFNSSLEPTLATMFAVLSDILWFTSDSHFSTVSWEYNIQFGKQRGDKNWRPTDEFSK